MINIYKRLLELDEYDINCRFVKNAKDYLRVASKSYPSKDLNFRGVNIKYFNKSELRTIIAFLYKPFIY